MALVEVTITLNRSDTGEEPLTHVVYRDIEDEDYNTRHPDRQLDLADQIRDETVRELVSSDWMILE